MAGKMIRRLRQTLPGVTAPPLRGDNLVICLASFFEPWVESEELDDSGTWKQEAIEHADAVIDAIAGHYSPEIARLESRIAELEVQHAKVERLEAENKRLQAELDADREHYHAGLANALADEIGDMKLVVSPDLHWSDKEEK